MEPGALEVAMDLGLTGRVAMITGGSHGLGKQAAYTLDFTRSA